MTFIPNNTRVTVEYHKGCVNPHKLYTGHKGNMKNRDLKRKVEDQHLYAHTNTESDMQGKKEAPHNFPTHKEAVTLTNGYSETRTAV